MTPRDRPDYSFVTAYVIASVEDLRQGKRVKDFKQYVFEQTLEAIYGGACWEEFNELEGDHE